MWILLSGCVITASSTYIRMTKIRYNKIGPSIDPWGTPLFAIGSMRRDLSEYVVLSIWAADFACRPW